jgi:hypothetical protein
MIALISDFGFGFLCGHFLLLVDFLLLIDSETVLNSSRFQKANLQKAPNRNDVSLLGPT